MELDQFEARKKAVHEHEHEMLTIYLNSPRLEVADLVTDIRNLHNTSCRRLAELENDFHQASAFIPHEMTEYHTSPRT